jgi:hypothetical protein
MSKRMEIDLNKFGEHQNVAVIVTLMMAVNDVQALNRLEKQVKTEREDDEYEFKSPLKFYLKRVMLSHLLEGILAAQKMENVPDLNDSLVKSSANEAFNRLLEYKDSGKKDSEFKFLKKIRNKGTFHYDTTGIDLLPIS